MSRLRAQWIWARAMFSAGGIHKLKRRLRLAQSTRLRTRLFLNLLPFVVILLAIGACAIALFSRLADKVDATMTDNYRSITAVEGMRQALLAMDVELRNIAVVGNGTNKLYSANRKRFEQYLAEQVKHQALPGERALNIQLVDQYKAFLNEIAAVHPIPTPKTGPADSRSILVRENVINDLLEEITALNYKAMWSIGSTAREITRNVTDLMLIGLLIALIISTYACLRLSRSILHPIQLLTLATRKLGEGALDPRVPIVSRDELGELAKSFNEMAAQLQEYRQNTTEEIVRLHRTMERTLASFPDPIFVLDSDGTIESKNPAAEDMAVLLRLRDELPAPLQGLARNTLKTGRDFLPHGFDEVVPLRIAEMEQFFLPRILLMRGPDQARPGVAVILYNVTRFRLLDALKTNLVATVSHELKSPLTSVRMVLHLLLEKTLGPLTPKQSELLLAARDDTERLLRILNDLLDLARLEEGAAALSKENVHPGELLQGVMLEMSSKVLAKGLKISCTIAPNLPPVSVDRQQINLVFTNLVSNAIKHSPPGGEVELRAVPSADHGVEFRVVDHGVGIPEEYHARIFDRFFRVPGQTQGGAGLGLSIAKEITMAHGGRIGLKSAPSRGTTIFVVLNSATR